MKIILTWNPLSTQSIYWHHWSVKFMKKEAKILKLSYIDQVNQEYKRKVIDHNVSIVINIYFSDKRKRDWDNYHKIAIDSLCWIVLQDDVLIQSATVNKHYDKENPRYEIDIL